MRQFVSQGEHLRRLGIGAVDEDEGREVVGEGKAPELPRVELAAGVVADYAVYHHEDVEGVDLLDEAPQGIGPSAQGAAFVEVEAQSRPYFRRVDSASLADVAEPTKGNGPSPSIRA